MSLIVLLHLNIDDIDYFARRKARNAWDYVLAKRIEELSSKNIEDKAEFERRLKILSSVIDPVEHQMQAGNFVSELCAFDDLLKKGRNPHWIQESKKKGIKSPDIYYENGTVNVPVEVKTLGLDEVEGTTLRSSTPLVHETGPDWSYFEGCKVKLNYFFADTISKFKSFDPTQEASGELYLYFFPSVHVRFRDGEDGQPLMRDRIVGYANEKLPASIIFNAINVLD